LADIIDILVLWSHGDAVMLIQKGAVLLAIATVEERDGLPPFRFAVGWPRSAGVPPPIWTHYNRPLDSY
jgi:hypothetical protein